MGERGLRFQTYKESSFADLCKAQYDPLTLRLLSLVKLFRHLKVFGDYIICSVYDRYPLTELIVKFENVCSLNYH